MDVQTLALKAARNENLSVLPAVATKVIQLAQNAETPSHKLEELITQDVALSTKVLKVANSSLYGGRTLSNIGRAISLLGFNAIRSVAVTLAFQQATSHRPSAANFSMLEFWSHSLGTAVAAKSLARHVAPDIQDELYLGGMLHDIGLLVLDRFEPKFLNDSVYDAKEKNIPLHVSERLRGSFDHAELGGLVVQKWEFSPILVNMIRYHHDVDSADEQFKKAVAILAIANSTAAESGLMNQAPHLPIEDKLYEMSGLKPEHITEATAMLVHELVTVQQSLSLQHAA